MIFINSILFYVHFFLINELSIEVGSSCTFEFKKRPLIKMDIAFSSAFINQPLIKMNTVCNFASMK